MCEREKIKMTDDIKILKALPVLQKIWNTSTLSDYFKGTITLLEQSESVLEKKLLIDTISKESERLYGKETATEISEQITNFPVIETGTHLAFLRDYDTTKKDDLRSRLNQNILISSALMRHVGQKYHIGVYGSDVSLNHPCGGGFFQLGDDIFPVTSLRQIGQMCLYDAPSMEKAYLNESLPLVAKLKILKEVLTNEVIDKSQSPHKEMMIKAKKITNSLLGPISNGRTNYTDVEKQYHSFNVNNQTLLKTTMLSLSMEAYKKYGYTFSDVDKQYNELLEVFNRRELKLPDQVALCQTKTINKILDGTGIKHISIDAVEIVCKFLISALEDKNSLWYKIFSNSENFKQMHQSFIGIRGSWKEGESPFDYVGRDKGFSKCLSLPLEKIDHRPEMLLPLLKEKKIVPSCSLIVLVFQGSGIMAHGGFFQTTYAEKIKKRFLKFLSGIGEIKRAEQLQKLPVDMALLSLAVVNDKTGKPMKLSEISRMSLEERIKMMDMIPGHSACRAVTKGLPVLKKYLDETAPGYIEAEAVHCEAPQLICHFDSTVNIISNIREEKKLERAS